MSYSIIYHSFKASRTLFMFLGRYRSHLQDFQNIIRRIFIFSGPNLENIIRRIFIFSGPNLVHFQKWFQKFEVWKCQSITIPKFQTCKIPTLNASEWQKSQSFKPANFQSFKLRNFKNRCTRILNFQGMNHEPSTINTRLINELFD